MFQVWSPRQSIAVAPLVDFTPSPKHPNVYNLSREPLNADTFLGLGRDCLRALFGKQFPPPLNWVKSGFS